MGNPDRFATTFIHNPAIARLSSPKWSKQHRYYVLKMSVNGLSMTPGLASWTMQGLSGDIKP